jgi:hypothetical protein
MEISWLRKSYDSSSIIFSTTQQWSRNASEGEVYSPPNGKDTPEEYQ